MQVGGAALESPIRVVETLFSLCRGPIAYHAMGRQGRYGISSGKHMQRPSVESETPGPAGQRQVNDLFDSPEFLQAVETDDFRHVLDHIPISIIVSKLVRGEQRIVYVNKAVEALMGQPGAELRGRDWSFLDVFRHEDDTALTLGQAMRTPKDFLGTFERPEPTHVLVEVYCSIIEREDGTERCRMAALVDVSERQRAQREDFARKIRDKDLLLWELQHRVKNNLQLITTLIRMEARYARDGNVADFERLAGRIESLQLLYSELASVPSGGSIDLGHYISQIASAAMRAHAVEGIRLDLKIENVPASINIAMPLGLIANELLTNAFKHAFVGRDGGTITLRCLRQGNGRCALVVADDGVGLPAGVEWPADGKLASLIVQTLRENADTELRVDSAPGAGTTVAISFACDTVLSEAA
jgi:PAS domain S-box-containing protein